MSPSGGLTPGKNDMATSRSAFITGTSGAIGRAIASSLTDHNWQVLGTHHENPSRNLDGFQSVKLSLEEATVEDISALLEESDLAPFDLVVHCAGNTRNQSILSMSTDDWRSVRRVHLDGGYRIARGARPNLNNASDPVHLLFVSSLVGIRGGRGQSNYAAAKGGLLGLTFSLAEEWAPEVNVNAIRPPLTESAMTDSIPDNRIDDVMSPVLTDDMASPHQTARLVQHIANQHGLTGQVLSADHRIRGPW